MESIIEKRRMSKQKKSSKKWKQYFPYYLMALPGLIYMICNNYLPMFGIIIAFKNLNFRKGILGSDWSGLDNFKFLFASKDAWIITRNTLAYNAVFIILTTVIAIALAVFLNEIRSKFASRLYQSLILLPYLMSWVIASYLVYAILAADTGLINNSILEPLGFEGISWYNTKKYWPYILVICQIWKSVGYAVIIYLSSIIGISPDYYEAASIDGASKWKQLTKITMPLLSPTVITMLILNVGRIFYSDFGLFYQVTRNSGTLYSVTRTIDVYVYNALMESSDFGMSSAASVYQSIVGLLLIITVNAVVRKYSKENALF
jgi:putative aldouronate transport system permease protein